MVTWPGKAAVLYLAGVPMFNTAESRLCSLNEVWNAMTSDLSRCQSRSLYISLREGAATLEINIHTQHRTAANDPRIMIYMRVKVEVEEPTHVSAGRQPVRLLLDHDDRKTRIDRASLSRLGLSALDQQFETVEDLVRSIVSHVGARASSATEGYHAHQAHAVHAGFQQRQQVCSHERLLKDRQSSVKSRWQRVLVPALIASAWNAPL